MADALDWLRQSLGGSQTPAAPPVGIQTGGGLLDLSPEEMAAFMRGGVGGYTGDPRFPRGANVPPPMQAPFGFNVGIQPRPFDWNAGANAQIGPFELGLSAQKYRPHIGGSLMYRRTIPF